MLVGRRRELDVLMRSLDEVGPTGGIALFLSGEPGIGKSTLLAFLLEAAEGRGFATASVVARNGSWAPPYEPWIAILEQLEQATIPLLPGIEAGMTADDHRHRVQQSVLRSIRDAASPRPAVIAVDDLQWMDEPSRDVLLDVLRGLNRAPVLLVGSWRTPIAAHDLAFHTFVANLHREPGARWLDLAGMDEADVAAIVEQLGWTISPAAVRKLTC